MKEIKVGDVLVWKELKGVVFYVYEDGGADIVFDGSKGPNVIDPGTAALAEVERPILTGADVLRLLADGRKPEEFEYRITPNSEWYSIDKDFTIASFIGPTPQFRVKP